MGPCTCRFQACFHLERKTGPFSFLFTGPNPKTTSKKGAEMGRKKLERKERRKKIKLKMFVHRGKRGSPLRKSRNWRAEGKVGVGARRATSGRE